MIPRRRLCFQGLRPRTLSLSSRSRPADWWIRAAPPTILTVSYNLLRAPPIPGGTTVTFPLQLRPVNFFDKPEYDDRSHQLQYGLIAEEVAKVYPEMVAYGKDGQLLTIKYQLLAPMLLNELQKQAEQVRSLEDRLTALETLLGAASGRRNKNPHAMKFTRRVPIRQRKEQFK
jgi:hypothetical protein